MWERPNSAQAGAAIADRGPTSGKCADPGACAAVKPERPHFPRESENRRSPRVPRSRKGRSNTLLRWGLLLFGIVAVNIVAARWIGQLQESLSGSGWSVNGWIGPALLAGYAVLLAIPFVPGAELGMSLLLMHGAAIAPFVHVSTVAGLSLAYGVGQAFATRLPCGFLARMNMPRACAFVDEMKAMTRNERLQRLKNAAPRWIGRWGLDYRYLLVALLINLPGNSLIGGGGGILMMAGMSRLFRFPALLLTIALATAPLPLAVWLFGADSLR